LGRPHEEPHKDAPEQAEEAAHEQSDGPETHEERWRKINAQAPQKPPERRGRSVWRYTKCPEVLLHSFQLVGICHARLTLELSGGEAVRLERVVMRPLRRTARCYCCGKHSAKEPAM
jgi:hypothetical protein